MPSRSSEGKPWSKEKVARRQTAPDAKWAQEISDEGRRRAHSYQEDAIFDPSQFFTWLVGRGGGKTTAFLWRFVIGMAAIERASFFYVAPTLGMATRLLWDPLKDLCYDQLDIDADFREVGRVCTFGKTGATLQLFGADDRREMDKLRGIPFNGIGLDEAALFAPDLLDWFIDRIITPRLKERRGWLGMASTPSHLFKGRFYEATRQGSPLHRPYALRDEPEYKGWKNWSSHAWSLADVAALPDAANYPAIIANWEGALETKTANLWGDDHPIWMREYLGKWATDAAELVYRYQAHKDGQPWNQWDPERVGPMKIAKLPDTYKDWNYGFGMDLGAKDPFALQVLAVSPSDPTRTVYHVWELERPEMYPKPIAQVLLGEGHNCRKPEGLIGAIGWPNAIVIDLAHLGANYLKELNNDYGLPCVGAERKPGAKHAEIELFNGLLLDGRIKVLKGSLLEQQLMELRWKEDEFRMVKEDKAQANHSSDAALMARAALANLLGQPEPRAAQPPPVDPMEPQPIPKRDDPLEPRPASGSFDDPFPW